MNNIKNYILMLSNEYNPERLSKIKTYVNDEIKNSQDLIQSYEKLLKIIETRLNSTDKNI